jgi:hypothetical protein
MGLFYYNIYYTILLKYTLYCTIYYIALRGRCASSRCAVWKVHWLASCCLLPQSSWGLSIPSSPAPFFGTLPLALQASYFRASDKGGECQLLRLASSSFKRDSPGREQACHVLELLFCQLNLPHRVCNMLLLDLRVKTGCVCMCVRLRENTQPNH